ncbi:MAG: siderophore ABC transporter substrate-binding protein [Coprobacillaceae bacterium]
MKKLTTLLLAVLMVVLVGCSNNDSKEEDTTKKEDEVITIKHAKGTTEINGEVKKAAVFDFGVLDSMEALDVDVEVALPVDNLPEYLNSFEGSTSAGGIKEPDMEALYTFEPDVIFISGRQSDYYDELSDIAPTIYVEINADTYMDDFKENTLNVAKIFGKEDAANKKIEAIEKEVEDAKEITEASDDKALVILTNDGSISAYGKGSRFGIVHDVLNVKTSDENIEVSTHGQTVNYEYISENNPDILFVVDRTQVVGGETEGTSTLDNDLVNGTSAAQNDKIVYLTPDYWYLSGGGLTSVSKMIEETIKPFK